MARQLLLAPAQFDAEHAIAAVAGLQGQRPDDPYIGLWSRLDRFEPSDLVGAQEERQVVKATLMRGTLHLVAAADYPLVAAALRPMVQRLWQRYLSDRPDVPKIEQITGLALQYAAKPRSPDELRRFLESQDAVTDLNVADLWWRVRTHGAFLHAPPSGAWRYRGRPSFVAAAAWLGVTCGQVDPAAAVDHLVRRYLGAFGPATAADFARWSGLGSSVIRLERGRLGDELVTYHDEAGRTLLDLADAVLPPEDQPAPVRLLPMWDTVLLGHDDRTRVLPDQYRRRVINHRGDVHETFLVDGVVAGLWQLSADKEDRPMIVLAPFEPLPAPTYYELVAEADRLLRFLADGRPVGEIVVSRER